MSFEMQFTIGDMLWRSSSRPRGPGCAGDVIYIDTIRQGQDTHKHFTQTLTLTRRRIMLIFEMELPIGDMFRCSCTRVRRSSGASDIIFNHMIRREEVHSFHKRKHTGRRIMLVLQVKITIGDAFWSTCTRSGGPRRARDIIYRYK